MGFSAPLDEAKIKKSDLKEESPAILSIRVWGMLRWI